MSINSNNSSNQNIDLKKSIPVQYKDLNPFQLQIHFIESESLFIEEKQNREGIVLDFIKSERQKLNQNLQQIVNDLQEYKNDFNLNKDEIDLAFNSYFNWKTSSLPNSSTLEKFYLENLDFVNEFNLNPNFSWLIKDLYEITYYRFALNYLNQKKQKELEKTDNEKIKQINLSLADDLIKDVYFKNRNTLSSDMFLVSIWFNPLNNETFELISWEIWEKFDAHWISKSLQIKQLLNILDNWIDESKDFFSAPFELPNEKKALLWPWLWTSWWTAYKDWLAVLTWEYNKPIKDWIKNIFINDMYVWLEKLLKTIYPKYDFYLLSEQKRVLEQQANTTF